MASEIPSVGSLSEYLNTVAKYSRERLTLTVFQELQHMSGGTFPDADMARKMATKWFRGQSEDLPLVPKLYRPGRRYDERAMVLDCRRKAAILGVVPEWSDYPSWLFLMQHHGLPTRLLDWTESSAVGLYFAIESWRSYRKDAPASAFSPVVWVTNPNAINWVGLGCSILPGTSEDEAVTSHGTMDPDFARKNLVAAFTDDTVAHQNPIAIRSRNAHVRMQVQRGTFTVHGRDKRSFTDIFAGTDLRTKGILAPIRVRPECAPLICEELRELGVTRSTLFPDLDGVAIDLAEAHPIL